MALELVLLVFLELSMVIMDEEADVRSGSAHVELADVIDGFMVRPFR
jgi:hypothetical protein